MTPGNLPLTLYRGDTYRWQFTLWQDDAKTLPFSLVGATVKAEIRTAPGGTLITSLVLVIVDPNVILAELPAASCALLTGAGGVWDLQVTYPGGDVYTVLKGVVTVAMDVTDSAAPAALGEIRFRERSRAA